MLPGAIGLIDMRYFAGFQAADAAARARADAAMTLVSGADAVIVDLRDNGGGSPAMVGYLASYFVPKDAPIYNTFKSRGPDAHETPPFEVRGERMLRAPLYILTSGRTGSAAEAFAYTLQAARRATIVGEASGGAANPGGFRPAGNGFRVFVSDGRPVNPITRSNWEGTGVQPDVAVPAGQALVRAQALALAEIRRSASGVAATEAEWAHAALSPGRAGSPGPGGLCGRLRLAEGRARGRPVGDPQRPPPARRAAAAGGGPVLRRRRGDAGQDAVRARRRGQGHRDADADTRGPDQPVRTGGVGALSALSPPPARSDGGEGDRRPSAA
ncbi:S41 family peptidase [Phenylobacterium sp. J367]|uniref:S41 family peptidase n=1 Tax=Phenylobacterium sp. J367 TaxID=2898435 RepID=UPI00215188A8|nr:S41 family peptidase [Phenylobacterium sp. J367]MCR5878011.1 S41 family peptidase [Phenylobacterium sp. J367]